MITKNNVQSIALLLLMLLLGVGESVAGVAYNQIKDGGVYTICCYFSTTGAKKYIAYDGTSASFVAAPSNTEYSYWVARKHDNGTFSFENFSYRGHYLNAGSAGIATSDDATGSVYELRIGHQSNNSYVSLYTNIPGQGNKYLGGWRDKNGYGAFGSGGCWGNSTNQGDWSTDWEFIDVAGNVPISPAPRNGQWVDGTRWYRIYMPATGGYMSQGTGYTDANGYMISNNASLPSNDYGLWCLVKLANGLFHVYNKGTGTTAVLSIDNALANNEKLYMMPVGGSGIKEQTWELFPTSITVNGNSEDGYLFYRNNGGTLRRIFNITNIPQNVNGNRIVSTYRDNINGDIAAQNWTDKFVLEEPQQTPWTVSIKENGSASSYKVVYDGVEYSDGETISAGSITPQSVSTTCNDKFVWGPIIDAENHTVTFEVRDLATSLTAGRFYQIQILDRDGKYNGNNWTTGNTYYQVLNSQTTIMKQSNIIYVMNYPSLEQRDYQTNISGIPMPEHEAYWSYVYIADKDASNNIALQLHNGDFVEYRGLRTTSKSKNWALSYNESDNSWKWNGGIMPWNNPGSTGHVALAYTSSGTQIGTFQTFFHPVTTGEDYDIYKVITAGEVECTNANLVTTIANVGGKFFFLQKGTAVTAGDFMINGSEPTAITTNTVNGYIELSLTERPHDVHEITSLASITDMYGYYKLTADINTPSQISTDFHGELDGNYHKVTGVSSALFTKLVNGTVKNLILEDVTISGDIVGAIANTATGNSRIYNCGILSKAAKTVEHDQPIANNSSTISGTTAGSIVGKIEGNARVVNCYSYADVNGTNAGGIVGDWAGTWYNGTTGLMVANCMYYGNLTGTNRSPIVYGGSDINDNYSIYSYFRWKSMSSTSFTKQNGALAATEDIWLDRFKFFQAGVTNHRDIAAYYVFGDATRISEMGQWYIDETIAPWPILRKAAPQKSVLSRVIPNTGNANEGNLITNVPSDIKGRYNMNLGNGNGKLSVTFNINGSQYTKDLPITDMDDKHYDYTWGKVVLPFANEFDGWTRDYDYICTGWEISNVVCSGSPATFSDYNYADRNCTDKDIYNATTNPIIFAQGGNYIVPYGVTAITVNAHFAKAYYLSDPSYDCAAGGANAHGGTRPTTYHDKTVYTTAAAAWEAMAEKSLPHDQALVLVGNYHYKDNVSGSHVTKGCTVMSIDEDCDQQPDYGWYSYRVGYRNSWMPIRWDFIPIVGAGMLQIDGQMPPGLSIPKAKGWFEMSETTLCRTFEFEISDNNMASADNANGNNAYIIKGGWFQQLVRCYDPYNASNSLLHNKLSYLNIGGNAYINEFFNGNHSGTSNTYSLRPVNVTGGEVVSCFMTDMGNKDVIREETNVRFYCSGGKIGKYLSVYQGYPVVDATMKVDHARIGRFFGGGTTPKAQLSGDIDITMNYSDVDFFCGGPEFGDMANEKSVTVNTTGSTYGEYYGAGFGGTALTRMRTNEGAWTTINRYPEHRLDNDNTNGGIGVSYEMEKLLSGDGNSLTRFYIYHAALSMAQTGNVRTNATNCLFKRNFFGGGCQGRVNGDITSVLDNCYVTGSVYGGGYKAEATTIDVYPATTPTYPIWNGTYKAYSQEAYPVPEVYKWAQGSVGTHDESAKLLYTDVNMSQMGEVTGNTSLTIKGERTVIEGDVFGGGAESKVLVNTSVVIGEQPQP